MTLGCEQCLPGAHSRIKTQCNIKLNEHVGFSPHSFIHREETWKMLLSESCAERKEQRKY